MDRRYAVLLPTEVWQWGRGIFSRRPSFRWIQAVWYASWSNTRLANRRAQFQGWRRLLWIGWPEYFYPASRPVRIYRSGLHAGGSLLHATAGRWRTATVRQ